MMKPFIFSIIVSMLLAATVIGALIEYKFLVK
ncbi:Uncharacterised protein [Enterobacter asburiae]|nr:Uncharacterised protein [Enterobacter asburiae]CZX78173.1 Uncharacterised protein [Enterobacter hormaechei]SQB53066.1 Uncharacterised protein [Escherichia coli]DAF03591.1 MAG TPA: protein of unknown function (DUF4969) [Caudoviricetes sp.]SAB86462.1 Uncharacterised protein [Enterobacter hormaechei]